MLRRVILLVLSFLKKASTLNKTTQHPKPQLSYAIGVAEPLSIYADTFGTGEVDDAAIEKAIRATMSLTPRGIREHLGLNRPIYQRTAAYGHFGRSPEADGGFSWECTDLVDALKAAV